MDCIILGKIPARKPNSLLSSSEFFFLANFKEDINALTLKQMKPCLVLISRLRGGECSHYSAGRPSVPFFPHVVTAINWHCYQITLGTQALFYISVSQCRKYSNSAETWLFWQVVLHWVTINMSFFDCVRVCRERGSDCAQSSALLGLNWQRFDNVCRIIRWNQSQVEEAPQLCLNYKCFTFSISLQFNILLK